MNVLIYKTTRNTYDYTGIEVTCQYDLLLDNHDFYSLYKDSIKADPYISKYSIYVLTNGIYSIYPYTRVDVGVGCIAELVSPSSPEYLEILCEALSKKAQFYNNLDHSTLVPYFNHLMSVLEGYILDFIGGQ